jgi:hypothetical protein
VEDIIITPLARVSGELTTVPPGRVHSLQVGGRASRVDAVQWG